MGRKRGGGGGGGGGGGMFGRKAAPAPSKAKPAPQRAAPAAAPAPAAHQQHHAPPPPAQHHAAPAPAAAAPSGGGMMSGFGGMVAQGMALGVGSSMGHHAVNGAMNMFSGSGDDKEAAAPAQQQQAYPQQAYPQAPAQNYSIEAGDACAVDQKQLYQCLQEQNNNAAACDFYFQALRACQENQQFQ